MKWNSDEEKALDDGMIKHRRRWKMIEEDFSKNPLCRNRTANAIRIHYDSRPVQTGLKKKNASEPYKKGKQRGSTVQGNQGKNIKDSSKKSQRLVRERKVKQLRPLKQKQTSVSSSNDSDSSSGQKGSSPEDASVDRTGSLALKTRDGGDSGGESDGSFPDDASEGSQDRTNILALHTRGGEDDRYDDDDPSDEDDDYDDDDPHENVRYDDPCENEPNSENEPVPLKKDTPLENVLDAWKRVGSVYHSSNKITVVSKSPPVPPKQGPLYTAPVTEESLAVGSPKDRSMKVETIIRAFKDRHVAFRAKMSEQLQHFEAEAFKKEMSEQLQHFEVQEEAELRKALKFLEK